MSDSTSVAARLLVVIARVVGARRTPPNVSASTLLGDGLWLDSIELLDVLVACESEFGLTFDDLPAQSLATFGALTSTIEARLQSQSSR